MSKYVCKFVKNGIGDPSSKYAFDKDGKQFEADVQQHIDESEKLYVEFVEWIKSKEVTPDKFRALFRRYYDEFIKGGIKTMNKLIETIKEIKIKTHQYAKNIINNNTMADEYLEWFNDLPNEYWTYASGVFLIFEQFIINKITQEQAKFLYDDITQNFIKEREMCLD